MPKNYSVPVYNTATGKYETVSLNKQQYDEFRRGKWNIEDKNKKFSRNEIPFSQLIRGNNSDDSGNGIENAHENFREFISLDKDPQRIIDNFIISDAIAGALMELDESDLALVLALVLCGKTEGGYAKEVGAYQVKIHRRKAMVLEILREKLAGKI